MKLPLPTQLRVLDGLDQIAHPTPPDDLPEAVRTLAAERGLTLTASQIQAVVAYADPTAPHPAPLDLWKRPRTLEEWNAFQVQERADRARQRRRDWGKAIGALGGGGVALFGLITGGLACAGIGMAAALGTAAGTLVLTFLAGCSDELDWWSDAPGMAQIRLHEAEHTSPWDEVTPQTYQFQNWVKVPGLAGCLAAILDSPVPWLREDYAQCSARMAAWKEKKLEAEERASGLQKQADLHRIVQEALADG